MCFLKAIFSSNSGKWLSEVRISLIVVFLLFIVVSCKKDQTGDTAGIDNKKSSLITILFKGKTYLIPYSKPAAGFANIEGNTFSRNESIGSSQPVSSVGVSGNSKELEVDFGGNRRGEPIGVYKYEKYTVGSNSYYFGVYLAAVSSISYLGGSMLNQHTYSDDFQQGWFTDLTDGNRDWDIQHKTSTITVTKSDATKLEGSFSLDLKYANSSQKATGTFNIYK